MSIQLIQDQIKTFPGLYRASTSYTRGRALTTDSGGYLIEATSASPGILGISLVTKQTTDFDYTLDTNAEYQEVIDREFEIDVVTGQVPTQANVGKFYSIPATGGNGGLIDISTTGAAGQFIVVGITKATSPARLLVKVQQAQEIS